MPSGIYLRTKENKIYHRIKNDRGTQEERFWKYVDKKGKNECWEWLRSKTFGGYGRIQICGKAKLTSRFSYELHFGKIPKDLFVLHRCDNPSCCNPKHLFLGTAKDNMIDKMNKGRCFNGMLGKFKLSKSKIEKIKKMYKTGEYTQKELGEKFKINQGTISNYLLCLK